MPTTTTKAFDIHANVAIQPSAVDACGAPRHQPRYLKIHRPQRGFTLVELIVFIVVISIALGAMLAVYQQSVVSSVDPIKRIRMLELAQAQLDRVMALRYDEATPMGGIPACSPTATPCTNTNEGDYDDVDDYNGFIDTQEDYRIDVSVILGPPDAKQISVTVTAPDNESLTLTAYRYNF